MLGLSLDRLADEDGQLARRFTLLGTFPAGFDAAAAAAVWQTEPCAARDDLDVLAEQSLVQVEAVGRYRLHDLVRDLAVARAAPAALEEAQARHAGYYVEVLARADDLFFSGGPGVLSGLALFDAQRDNVEAAQLWAVGSAGDGEAAALVARYAKAGSHVLALRLPPRRWIEWLKAALTACRRLGDRRGEGAALGNLGNTWAACGEPRKAVEFHEQQLAIAREVGDRNGEDTGLYSSAIAYEQVGEHDKARVVAEAALVIFRAIASLHVAATEAWLRRRGVEP